MINTSNQQQDIDKYKSYFYLSLMAIYVLFTVSFMMFRDVHKQEEIISKNQSDLAYMTAKTIEQQSIINEIESDSKMIEDLKNIDKEYR